MVTEKLTQQVRRKLNITWNDTETDARVAQIIENAIPYLLHKLGIRDPEFDFSAPGTENTLFLACCLYDWNHVPRNEYEDNYSGLIGDVQRLNDVKYYQAEQEASADE